MLLLAGCAAPVGTPAVDDLSASGAVRAFSSICGLDRSGEVVQRASTLGFIPLDRARLAPQRENPDPAIQWMVRAPATPTSIMAVLAWHTAQQSCEIAFANVAAASVEREFARYIQGLSRQADLVVGPVPLPTDPRPAAARVLRPHSAFLVSSRTRWDAAPQIVLLHIPGEAGAESRIQAVLRSVPAPLASSGATPPASSMGALKQ